MLASVVALACSGPEETREPSEPSEPEAPLRADDERAPEPPPAEPAATSDPRPREEPAHAEPPAAPPGAPPAPERGCAMAPPVRVAAGDWASVAAIQGGFAIVTSAAEGDGEVVLVVRESGETIARARLEHAVVRGHRRAAPAIAGSGGRLAVAIVDGRRRLLLTEVRAGARGAELAFVPAGADVSLRIAPALAPVGEGWAVAWTEEPAEGMRVRGGIFEGGALRAVRELRSDAGGAAAPAFVRGARDETIVFLEPRAGVSLAYRARASRSGFDDPTIARPINLVTEPPELAAVRAGERDWIAYTAIGTAATTAVGLAPLEGTAPPVPLVAGTGYGVLHVDGASLGGPAVLVADAPQGVDRDAPREVHVRVLDADGAPGAPAVVRGPGGAASRGRVAAADGGTIGVTFTEGDAIYFALGRCAR
ncbi:MAG TPA: hypothetical protein VIL20_22020 [Sandaracinaceae bacterium]